MLLDRDLGTLPWDGGRVISGQLTRGKGYAASDKGAGEGGEMGRPRCGVLGSLGRRPQQSPLLLCEQGTRGQGMMAWAGGE